MATRELEFAVAVSEHELVSATEFLQWVGIQQDRFELVGGRIVRMMTGAKQSHNVVTSNIVVALSPQAKRRGCRTTSSDTAVRTGPQSVRYPDVVVDCGSSDPTALKASRPTLLVEVASPGTSAIETTDKLDEYRAHEDIRLIVFVDPDVVSVKVYRRDSLGLWHVEKYDGLDRVIELPEIGGSLSLGDIYDTLDPVSRPRPRIVEELRGGTATR